MPRHAAPDFAHLACAPFGWWKAFKGAKPADAPDTATLSAELRETGWRGPVLSAAAAMIDEGPALDGTICVSEAHAPSDGRYSRYALYAADGAALLADLIAEGASTREKLRGALAAQRRTGKTGSLAFAPDGRRESVELPAFEARGGAWLALS